MSTAERLAGTEVGYSTDKAVLHFKPRRKFIDWLKKALPGEEVIGTDLDHDITDADLSRHAVTFLIPKFDSFTEFYHYLDKKAEGMMDLLLGAWPVDMNNWPSDRSKEALLTLFDFTHFPYFIDLENSEAIQQANPLDCAMYFIYPRQKAFDWFTRLNKEKNIRPPHENFLDPEVFSGQV